MWKNSKFLFSVLFLLISFLFYRKILPNIVTCYITPYKISYDTSTRPEVFCKKVFLEHSQTLQENTGAGVSF